VSELGTNWKLVAPRLEGRSIDGIRIEFHNRASKEKEWKQLKEKKAEEKAKEKEAKEEEWKQLSRYRHGDGPCHSDGTWNCDLTLSKVIMKDVGGTFFLRDDFGYWRFVELAPEEYLILPSASGARYHFAAHLKKVGEPHPVTKVQKFIAEEAEVTSLILHIGRVDRSVSGRFVEEAVAFAEGR